MIQLEETMDIDKAYINLNGHFDFQTIDKLQFEFCYMLLALYDSLFKNGKVDTKVYNGFGFKNKAEAEKAMKDYARNPNVLNKYSAEMLSTVLYIDTPEVAKVFSENDYSSKVAAANAKNLLRFFIKCRQGRALFGGSYMSIRNGAPIKIEASNMIKAIILLRDKIDFEKTDTFKTWKKLGLEYLNYHYSHNRAIPSVEAEKDGEEPELYDDILTVKSNYNKVGYKGIFGEEFFK